MCTFNYFYSRFTFYQIPFLMSSRRHGSTEGKSVVYVYMLLKVMRGHGSSVRDIAFSASGRHLASAALDGEVRIWFTTTGSHVSFSLLCCNVM